jgi:hypothetical protein
LRADQPIAQNIAERALSARFPAPPERNVE